MSKTKKRREFLITSLKASATIPFLGLSLASCNTKSKDKKVLQNVVEKKLNILILGGTSFLGPHQIAYALERGHSITTFTRGKTKPTVHNELFENVEQLIGDRENNLEALHNRKWDAVIDNSGHKVEWTRATAELLKDNVGLYLYTSSTGVYYPYLQPDIKENRVLLLEMPDKLEFDYQKMEYEYGVMKANSELEAKNIFGEERAIIVRPTYMIGPGDRTDRFMHWPVRLNNGGEMLIPGKVDDPVQFIDVRDIASWMIRLIEKKNFGTYNGAGPENSTGMHAFAKDAHKAFDSKATFIAIDDYDFLASQNVHYIVPWIMPTGNNKCTAMVNNQHSKNNGLTFTKFKKTMSDIYEWWCSDALSERRIKFESDPDSILQREKSIIDAWKQKVVL